MILLYIVLGLLFFKFLLNLTRYIQCRLYLTKYRNWLKSKTWKLVEDKSQVVRLLQEAGVKDSFLPYVEPVGYGKLRTANVSVFDNFPNGRSDFVKLMIGNFYQAIGFYRSRCLETINPLYWIEFFLYLPRHITSYLGITPESTVTKVAQIIYLGMAPLVGFAYSIYKPEIDAWIKNWISSLFP